MLTAPARCIPLDAYVGLTLLSRLFRDRWCVDPRVRTGTLRTSQASSLPPRRVLVGQLWFWVVGVVLSILPSSLSPLFIRNRFFSTSRVDYISVCTRAKHGHAFCVTGGSDPTFGHDSVPKVNRGSLQPNTALPRGQTPCPAVRNFLSFGHLLDRHSDCVGDGYADLCLSCTRHLPH